MRSKLKDFEVLIYLKIWLSLKTKRRYFCRFSESASSEAVQMLEWIAAVCIMVVMAILWPIVKCFGEGSQSTLLLQGLEIPRRESKRSTERCDSNCATGTQQKPGGRDEAPTVALICKPSALANYLLKHCMTFCKQLRIQKFNWRVSSSLQTIFGAVWPYDCPVHFIRDHLQLSDDGLVALDWAVVGAHHKRRRTSSNSTSPILLVIPNSIGKITRNVLKVISKHQVATIKHADSWPNALLLADKSYFSYTLLQYWNTSTNYFSPAWIHSNEDIIQPAT